LSGLTASDFIVEGIDTADYPEFSDAYIMEASVYQNGTWREATEDELDELNEDADLVYWCVENYLF
jgi:predicted neuraminidase